MKRTFLIDFDATIAYNDYPFIGEEVPEAIRVLKRLNNAGHSLILLTMRHKSELADAKKWLQEKGVYFDYYNENPEFETGSRKVYGHLHIDDHNIGIKLIHDTSLHYKPFVDWLEIERILEEKELL